VQFLVQKFSVFGFGGQNWMPIVFLLIAAFALFAWRTRDKA
jgi:hypothetical protein